MGVQDELDSLPTEISYNLKHKKRHGTESRVGMDEGLWRFSAADKYIDCFLYL